MRQIKQKNQTYRVRLCLLLTGLAAICLFFVSFFLTTILPSHADASFKKFSKSSLEMFDTLTIITGYDTDETAFEKKANRLFAALKEYHELYDIYHNYEGFSNLKSINDSAGIAPVQVDERILDMLEYAVKMYNLTEGKTNIAMGSVLKVWHKYRSAAIADPKHATLPEKEELERAAAHTDIRNLIIDRSAGTVYLADPEMSLDVGAVAKGYAADKLAELAQTTGWNHIALSVGGNIKTIGTKGDGKSWQVGIQTPDSSWEQPYFCLVRLDDLSLVTSGSYQRYFTVEGKRYHHIINPDTLYPENTFLSISVLCESSALGDALSTALFHMNFNAGQTLINTLPGVEAVWIYPDGSYVLTSGMKQYLLKDKKN